MRAIIKYKGKRIEIPELKKCNSIFEKFYGLMFCSRKKARALLFDFGKPTKTPIHSFFVFFPFIAVWLNEKNKIIEIKIIQPFNSSIKPKTEFSRLIEIPLNEKYEKIIHPLVENRNI